MKSFTQLYLYHACFVETKNFLQIIYETMLKLARNIQV